jgi:hypothetical protein
MSDLPHPLCRNLSSKKLMMLPEGHAVTAADLATAGYHNYWCLETMTDTARDGGWVTYERCGPERACYQPPAE